MFRVEPDLYTNGGQMNNRQLVMLATGKLPITREELEYERKKRVQQLFKKKQKKKRKKNPRRKKVQGAKGK